MLRTHFVKPPKMNRFRILRFTVWFVAVFTFPVIAETIRFPDGVHVEIIKSEYAASMDYEKPLAGDSEGKSMRRRHSYTAETTHYQASIHMKDMKTATVFHKATWATKAKVPALMLLVKAKLPDGRTLLHDSFHMHGETSEVERKDGTVKELGNHQDAYWKPEDQPLHFQVTDGANGWRDMDGPVVFDQEDGHGVVSTHVFPRLLPELRFRVLRKGQPAQFLTIKNPAYRTDIPALKPSARPYKITMEDGTYTLTSYGMRQSQAGRSFRPVVSFDRSVKPASGIANSTVKTETAVYDAQDNYYPAGRFRDRIWSLADEHLFRLVMRVVRMPELYPWKKTHTTIIAEGRAGNAASELPSAKINAEGTKLGFETVRFKISEEDGEKDNCHRLPWNFAFVLEGENRSHDEFRKTAFCLFPKAGGVQKEIHGPMCGGSSLNLPLGFKTIQRFDLECDWLGNLAPGEEFEIGLINEPFEEAEFIIDLNAPGKFDIE